MLLAVILSALAVLPTDRLAMADRLFNRGKFAEAQVEYRALKGAEGIAPDQLLFRLAECANATGAKDEAAKCYRELLAKFPDSEHAPRARLSEALTLTGEARLSRLKSLDTDRVEPELRAIALYHLGVANNDVSMLERCVKLSPKGRYADYADMRRGVLMNAASDAKVRRKGMEILLGVAFGGGNLADEALYLAAVQSYREKRWGETGSLLKRYLKRYPDKSHAAEAKQMTVWCDFMSGRYVDVVNACGKGETDDFAYLLAASANATGDSEKAIALYRKYLDGYPEGRYRKDAELPLARLEFDLARKQNDNAKLVEAAKRAFASSKLPADELRLAWALEKTGNAEAAAANYDHVAKAAVKDENSAEALYSLAMMSARAQNWAKAEMTLSEALATGKLGKRQAAAHYWRGVAAMKLAHAEEAVKSLKTALAMGLGIEESREARLMIADYDLRAGRKDEAKRAYATLLGEGAAERISSARLKEIGELLFGEPAAKTCAEALIRGEAAEWRQIGYELKGRILEKEASYTGAIDAYRKCIAEKCLTSEATARALLALGRLETRSGEYDRAEATLKEAVKANSANPRARAEAYLALARNSEAKGDAKAACGYATVIESLFDDAELVKAAQAILKAHPEGSK